MFPIRNNDFATKLQKMKSTLAALFILAGAIALSAVLYVGGCVFSKNWYPMFTLLPAVFSAICAYGFSRSDPTQWTDSKISEDAWLFLLMFGVSSCIGLPIVLYRCGFLGWKGLAFHFAGDAAVGIGFGLFLYCSSPDDGTMTVSSY